MRSLKSSLMGACIAVSLITMGCDRVDTASVVAAAAEYDRVLLMRMGPLVRAGAAADSLQVVVTYPGGCTEATVLPVTPLLSRAIIDYRHVSNAAVVTHNVLDNDIGASLALTDVRDPAGGDIVFSSTGSVTYTPDSTFSGLEYI